ncbi:MAG: hypothetical protein WC748_08735 [Legionellales bacterium]|jgi:acetoin utilization deacetylase AcuC-like enzyme
MKIKPAEAKKNAIKKEIPSPEEIARQRGVAAAYRGRFYPNGPDRENLQGQGYTDEQIKAYIEGFNATVGNAEVQMKRFVTNQLSTDRFSLMVSTTENALKERFPSWTQDVIEEYLRQTALEPKNQEHDNKNEKKLKNYTKAKLVYAVHRSIAQGCIPNYARYQKGYQLDTNQDFLETLAATFLERRLELNEYFEKYRLVHKAKKDKDPDTLSENSTNNLRIAFLNNYQKFINKLRGKIKSDKYNKEFDALEKKIAAELEKYPTSQNKLVKNAPVISRPKRNLEEEKMQSHQEKESSTVDKYYKDLTDDISFEPIRRLFNFVISLKNYIIIHNNLPDNDRLGYLVYLYFLINKLKLEYSDAKSRSTIHDLSMEMIAPVLKKIRKKKLSYYLPDEGKNCRKLLPDDYMEKHTRIEELEKTFEQLAPLVKKNDDDKSEPDFSLLTKLNLHHSDYLEKLSAKDMAGNHITLADENNDLAPGDNLLTPDTEALLLANLGVVNAAVEKQLQSLDDKKSNKIFCAIRPPSHHAQHDHASGFCLMNTVVAAALRLLRKKKKIMIIDFDVHHGDGNYAQFIKRHHMYKEYYRLIDVYIEAKHAPFIKNQPSAAKPEYSDNISLNELKEGYTGLDLLNTIKSAVEKFNFKPDVILVCAGFDALKGEKFNGGVENPQEYYAIGAYLASLSDNVISFLEGGYNLKLLAQSVFYYVLGTGTLLPDDKQLPTLHNSSEVVPTMSLVANGIEHVYQKTRNKGKTDAPTDTETNSNNKHLKLGSSYPLKP